MDFQLLYAIQAMHSPVLDQIILALTKVMGGIGQFWLILAVILLIPKKTRRCGIAMFVSYVLVLLVGHVVLKDLIARPRPCHIDQTVALLVERPTSFSCPSTHTAWAFAAAVSVLWHNRKAGIAVLVCAVLIGFSRMYLFVHFPTDVLFGAVLGAVLAAITCYIMGILAEKRKKK